MKSKSEEEQYRALCGLLDAMYDYVKNNLGRQHPLFSAIWDANMLISEFRPVKCRSFDKLIYNAKASEIELRNNL